MTDNHKTYESLPPAQHLPAHSVVSELAEFGRNRIENLTILKILILAIMGGAFITAGALFSILLASGFESYGVRVLVEGIGFSTGFFFVVLSEAVLFTEANVVMRQRCSTAYRPPAVYFGSGVLRSWGTSSERSSRVG